MSRKIRMNCYGQDTSLTPPKGFIPILPYQFKTIDKVAYCRFDSRRKTAIQRMEKSEVNEEITQTWAFGPWDGCETLRYHPINTILEVEV